MMSDENVERKGQAKLINVFMIEPKYDGEKKKWTCGVN
jgi:hypothetical protein